MSELDLSRQLRLISNLTEQERQDLRWDRQKYDGGGAFELEAATSGPAATLSGAEVAALVSERARDLVILYEVTSRRAYERLYNRPLWPGGASGVTIGIGYDVGYASPKGLADTWRGLISFDYVTQLAKSCHVTGDAARQMTPQFHDITIPWDAAMEAFNRHDLPNYGRQTLQALPNSEKLPPDCFGAMFSLVYNCGPRMQDRRPGDRTEMRAMRDAIQSGDFARVPGELRKMKRLWPGANQTGLPKRREAEAVLFEAGLASQAKPVAVAQAASTSAGGLESVSTIGEAGDLATWSGNFEADMPAPDSGFEANHQDEKNWGGVHWPDNDDDAPDYRHIIGRQLKDASFEFTARDLDLLIRANSFVPDPSQQRIIFGLRGCQLVASLTDPEVMDKQVDRDTLTLRDTRPDHKAFRCVFGSYNLVTRRLSGFKASTVPCRRAVYGYQSHTGGKSNMVPSGCYGFFVGTHNGKPGCFREAANKTVLRTVNDLVYDIRDVWDDCGPGDDLHPAFFEHSAAFSSFGCLTVSGNSDPAGNHTGAWKDFRGALGLLSSGTGDDGRRFDVVLLTGLEAAIAANLRKTGRDTDRLEVKSQLTRLRQGSRGEIVKRLQAALGRPQDGRFDHGLTKALAVAQTRKLQWADGVFSPKMEDLLQLPGAVFREQMISAAPVSHPEGVRASGERDEFESLFYEIGARSQALATSPNGEFRESVFQELSVSDVTATGRRIYRRIERSAQGLICGDGSDDAADRQSIQQSLNLAASQGAETVETVLSAVLTAQLGILAVFAQPAAKLIVKRVLRPALEEAGKSASETFAPRIQDACKAWATTLRARETASGGQAS